MHVLMGDMHKGLGDATLEVSSLILKPVSMKRFRTGEMLDDHCLDRMLEYLVQATGSKMVGVKEDATFSPWVTTDIPPLLVRTMSLGLRTLNRA